MIIDVPVNIRDYKTAEEVQNLLSGLQICGIRLKGFRLAWELGLQSTEANRSHGLAQEDKVLV